MTHPTKDKRGPKVPGTADARTSIEVAKQALRAALALLEVAGTEASTHNGDDRIPHPRCILGKRKTLALIHRGELAAERVGRVYFIRKSELEDYLERHTVRPAPPPEGEAVDELLAATAIAGRRAPRPRRGKTVPA